METIITPPAYSPFINVPPPSPEGELMETINSAFSDSTGFSPPPSPEGELMETFFRAFSYPPLDFFAAPRLRLKEN